MPFFTLAQQKALSIAPRISGSASMFGSGCIICSIVSEMKSRRSRLTTYKRLVLGMSCMDFLTSFWFALSTWPIPRGTPGVWSPLGNTTTCTVQGFFTGMVVAVPLYNAVLAFHPLMLARFNWKEEQFCAAEPYMHALPLTFSIGQAIAGLPLKLFNNANLWCWIAPFPFGCKDSLTYGESGNCVRGDNAWVFRMAFGYGPAWVCCCSAMICMILVYRSVLQGEKDIDNVQHDGIMVRRQSKRVAWQAFWYVIAFYITWVPATIARILQFLPAKKGKVYFLVFMLNAVFLPMQGFLNFFVFARARYLRYRRNHPNSSLLEALGDAVLMVRGETDEAESVCQSEGLPDMPKDVNRSTIFAAFSSGSKASN